VVVLLSGVSKRLSGTLAAALRRVIDGLVAILGLFEGFKGFLKLSGLENPFLEALLGCLQSLSVELYLATLPDGRTQKYCSQHRIGLSFFLI